MESHKILGLAAAAVCCPCPARRELEELFLFPSLQLSRGCPLLSLSSVVGAGLLAEPEEGRLLRQTEENRVLPPVSVKRRLSLSLIRIYHLQRRRSRACFLFLSLFFPLVFCASKGQIKTPAMKPPHTAINVRRNSLGDFLET